MVQLDFSTGRLSLKMRFSRISFPKGIDPKYQANNSLKLVFRVLYNSLIYQETNYVFLDLIIKLEKGRSKQVK